MPVVLSPVIQDVVVSTKETLRQNKAKHRQNCRFCSTPKLTLREGEEPRLEVPGQGKAAPRASHDDRKSVCFLSEKETKSPSLTSPDCVSEQKTAGVRSKLNDEKLLAKLTDRDVSLSLSSLLLSFVFFSLSLSFHICLSPLPPLSLRCTVGHVSSRS